MKNLFTKMIVFCVAICLSQSAFSQVVFRVTSPVEIAGAYSNSHPTDWGGRVTGRLDLEAVVVNDGSAFPTRGCNASPANAYDGKIVLIRRGDCEFGMKALNAENAGTAAVLVVNNVAGGGAPGMGAGALGSSVTIPVFSVSFEDGELFISAIQAGETVIFSIYPAAFSLTLPYYPAYYAAVPECLNRETVDSMGITITNSSRSDLDNVVVKYQIIDKTNNVVMYHDSMELPSFIDGQTLTFEWDLSDSPIDISGWEKGVYAFEYIVYYRDDMLDEPGTYRTSQEFRVTDGLWTHENVVSNSYRPGDGGDHTDGGLFYVPENIFESGLKAMTLSFVSANNTDETTMAGKDVIIFMAKIVSDSFDFSKDIYDESQFELLGYSEFTFSDEAQRFQRIEVPLIDIESDEQGIDLDPASEYMAVVSYNGASNQLFHGYSLDLTYPTTVPFTTSLVYGSFTGSQRWVFYANNDRRIVNSIRLGLEYETCIIGTEEVIPEAHLQIFPNPSSEYINMTFDFDQATDLSVILTDMQGRVVRWQSYKGVMNDNLQFDVNQVSSGNYLLHFATKNGQRAEKVIVLK